MSDYTKAQNTALPLGRYQQDFLMGLAKDWSMGLDLETLESLADFECVTDRFQLTDLGVEVAAPLESGFAR